MQIGSTGSVGELVDTNVFVYAADPAAGERQVRSMRLIEDLVNRGTLVVSTQTLNELYARLTRPNRPPALSHDEAHAIIQQVSDASLVLPLTPVLTFRALEAVPRYLMSFWDALIWAAAREHGITVIHTEDVQSAPEIEGVRYVNPFSAAP